ncbi:MAG: endonuclease III [Succinivibrionaceae bacterium]|nr:endonuclease III [Succinivibrionaceae bacterium]
MAPDEREELFARLAAAIPNPRSALAFSSPFELLVAVALSAQTTDVAVNQVTPALFAAAPTPKALAALGEERIGSMVRSLGLWRGKAHRLVGMAQALLERHGGEVPRDLAALTALPGVGGKTARVVLNVAFGLPYVAVDTHVFRVCRRTGLCLGKDPAEVQERLPGVVPGDYLVRAHHLLLLHGRQVCMARKPRCEGCPLAGLCPGAGG